MPPWCSLPLTATACGCESVTACCASTSSPSSTTPRSPPITTLPSAIYVTPPPTGRSLAASAPAGAPISLPPSAPSSAPPHGGASMPTRRSTIPYRVTPSSPRVEQVRIFYSKRETSAVCMSDDSQNSLTAASDVLTLAHRLHAGDLEVILLTVLMAVDENHVPCSKEA